MNGLPDPLVERLWLAPANLTANGFASLKAGVVIGRPIMMPVRLLKAFGAK
jgi:hypothetical protein